MRQIVILARPIGAGSNSAIFEKGGNVGARTAKPAEMREANGTPKLRLKHRPTDQLHGPSLPLHLSAHRRIYSQLEPSERGSIGDRRQIGSSRFVV